jgi:hypothetical protein
MEKIMSRDDLTAKQMDAADELAQTDTDRAVREWIEENSNPGDLKRLVVELVRVNGKLVEVTRKIDDEAKQGVTNAPNAQFIYFLIQQSELNMQAQLLIDAIQKFGSPEGRDAISRA